MKFNKISRSSHLNALTRALKISMKPLIGSETIYKRSNYKRLNQPINFGQIKMPKVSNKPDISKVSNKLDVIEVLDKIEILNKPEIQDKIEIQDKPKKPSQPELYTHFNRPIKPIKFIKPRKTGQTDLCDGLILKDFLTAQSKHAIVFHCEYEGTPAICKFVILESGAFWSEHSKKMVRKNEIPVGNYRIPPNCFMLKDYFRKVPVKKERFNDEINNLQKLGGRATRLNETLRKSGGICPQIFHYFYQKLWLNGRDYMDIGCIIMEKVDCTLEDVIKSRILNTDEIRSVVDYIKNFSVNYVHGDFKGANIGVNLDNQQNIIRIITLDVDNIRSRGQISPRDFHDRQTYDMYKFFDTLQATRGVLFEKTSEVLSDIETIRELLSKETKLPLPRI